jgi:hypothetical protein
MRLKTPRYSRPSPLNDQQHKRRWNMYQHISLHSEADSYLVTNKTLSFQKRAVHSTAHHHMPDTLTWLFRIQKHT